MLTLRRPFGWTLLLTALAGSPALCDSDPQSPTIHVNAAHGVAAVPRRLFGTNLRQNMEQDERIRQFLKTTGIRLFRYPDSVDSGYQWNWDAGGVMCQDGKPMISRLARFDGAVELAQELRAELFFTLNIHNSTPEQAGRWVAEAKKRGVGGSYWCFGNEPYFKNDKHYIPREDYVKLVETFAPVMKQADPEIHLGVAWGGPWIEENSDKGRDSFVLRGTRQWVDFVDFHFYTGRWDKQIDARRIMAGSLLVAGHVAKFREIIRREAPDKADRIEIHYWEWNGPPWPKVGGIQTLATALFAADALGEMARCGVKAAIQYNLQEHACGLIPGWEQAQVGSWPTETWNGKTVRPLALAIEMWSRHMGPILVESAVRNVGRYRTKDWHTLVNYQGEVPLMAAHATRSEDRRELQVLIINRNDQVSDALVSLQGFEPRKEAEVLTLSGSGALSHNDVTDRQPAYHSFGDAPDPVVKLAPGAITVPMSRFRYSFPAYSATLIRMRAR